MKRCVLILCMIVPIAGCAVYNEEQQSKNNDNPDPAPAGEATRREMPQSLGSSKPDPIFAGTTIMTRELRKGKGPLVISPEERREVDLNSIVKVDFSRSTGEGSTTDEAIVATLKKIKELALRLKADRERINKIKVDENQPDEEKKKKVNEINKEAANFNKDVMNFIRETMLPQFKDESEAEEVLPKGYDGIIAWAVDKIEKSLVRVGVEALLYKQGATPQTLAIRGYNDLADGKLRSDTPLIGTSKETIQRAANTLSIIRTSTKSDNESNQENDPNKDLSDNKEKSDELADAAEKGLSKINHLLSLDIAEGNPARIELSRTSALEGDQVDVIVRFYKKKEMPSAGDTDTQDMKAVKTITYPLEIVRAGLNHRTAVDVIFARADRSKNGDSER